MKIRTISPGEEPFLIEAPHDPDDWRDPDRIGNWAPKVQLAQTAQALDDQGVVGQQAYRMAAIAGYTSKEAGYIAKLIRTGNWRSLLEAPVKMSITELLREPAYA